MREGPIGKDLKRVRNVKPFWSKFGTFVGIPLGAVDMWLRTLLGGWSPFGTLSHGKTDAAALKPRPTSSRFHTRSPTVF